VNSKLVMANLRACLSPKFATGLKDLFNNEGIIELDFFGVGKSSEGPNQH